MGMYVAACNCDGTASRREVLVGRMRPVLALVALLVALLPREVHAEEAVSDAAVQITGDADGNEDDRTSVDEDIADERADCGSGASCGCGTSGGGA